MGKYFWSEKSFLYGENIFGPEKGISLREKTCLGPEIRFLSTGKSSFLIWYHYGTIWYQYGTIMVPYLYYHILPQNVSTLRRLFLIQSFLIQTGLNFFSVLFLMPTTHVSLPLSFFSFFLNLFFCLLF